MGFGWRAFSFNRRRDFCSEMRFNVGFVAFIILIRPRFNSLLFVHLKRAILFGFMLDSYYVPPSAQFQAIVLFSFFFLLLSCPRVSSSWICNSLEYIFSLSLVYAGSIFCFSLARKLFQHHSSEFSERYSSYSLLIDSTYKHRMRDWEKKRRTEKQRRGRVRNGKWDNGYRSFA